MGSGGSEGICTILSRPAAATSALIFYRDAQSNEEIVEIYFRLGQIKLKQNEKKKALNFFEKALARTREGQ